MTRREVCQQLQYAGASEHDRLGPLLLAVSGGCATSFAEFYRDTHRQTFGIVLRIVRHHAEAEEVLQEIYFRVWVRSKQFDPQRGLAIYWLASIAHRAAIDCLRRSSCRPREVNHSSDDAEPYDEMATLDVGPLDVLEQAQTTRHLVSHLSSLPLEQQECLALAFLDGLSHSQIAVKLSRPLGTIKARIRRGLISMRATGPGASIVNSPN